MGPEGVAPIDLAILGGVTLRDDTGRDIPLAPQRARILAILAAAAGRVVARADLVEDLWGDDSEASRHRLNQQITQLRRALGEGLRIDHHHDGFCLGGELERIDAVRFESLLAGGEALDASAGHTQYLAALALVRGPPFHGIDSLLVDDARRHLEARREAAELRLADCEIALRLPGAAVELLRQRIDDDPTAADVATRLATLLAIAQRDVEARRVVGRHRAARRDAGFALDPTLDDLERAILRLEFGTPLTTVSGAEPDAAFHRSERLVPRPTIEGRVRRALAAAPVLLVGEAGVGKSVLALAVARAVEDEGHVVVRTAAPAEPTRPMEPVAALVEQLLRVAPQILAGGRPAQAAAVARVTGDHQAAGALSREVMIAELIELLRSVVLDTGTVLVVEDAHWLDHSSAEILAGLRHDPGLLLTARRPLGGLFGEEWEQVPIIELPPFDHHEVRALVDRVVPGRVTDGLVERLHAETGGNGVFLRLRLDALEDGDDGGRVSPTLLEAVNGRTSRFSSATRAVLQTAALLGPSFALAPLAVVHPEFASLLRDAIDDRLVSIDAAGGQFVHGLVVDALVEQLTPAARVTRHDQLCRAWLALGGSAVSMAKHAVGAETLDPMRAVLGCLGAARQQSTVFEWETVIVWARLGIDIVQRSGMDDATVEAELRMLIGTGLRRLNRVGSAEELSAASDLAAAAGAHELLVRSVTELCLHGPTTQAGSVDAVGRRHLERALAAPVDSRRRARLLAAAATLTVVSDASSRGRALYHEALREAETSGDALVMRSVWMNAHLGLCHPDDLDLMRRACAGLLGAGDDEAQWEGEFLRVGLALIDADRNAFDDAVRGLDALTNVVKQRDHQRSMLQVHTVHAFIRGDLERADSLAGEAFQACLASYPVSWATSIYATLLVPIREAQGRVGELQPEVVALTASAPDFVTWHAVAAAVAYARHDRQALVAAMARLAGNGFCLAEDMTWTAIATMITRPIRALGDTDAAALMYERLRPYSGLMSWNGLSTHGPIDAGLACLADVLGDSSAAAEHVHRARERVAQLRAPHLWWPELDDIDAPDDISATA